MKIEIQEGDVVFKRAVNGWIIHQIVYDEGEFKENLYEGRGTFRYLNGNVYEGEYRAGWKEGRGAYRYKTGEVYEGK